MIEWEKLLAGKVYHDFDNDLFHPGAEAKRLFRAYNTIKQLMRLKRDQHDYEIVLINS